MKTVQDKSKLLAFVCVMLAIAWGCVPQASSAEAEEKSETGPTAGSTDAPGVQAESEEEGMTPTHEELSTIPVKTEVAPGSLRTFCLSTDGNLLVACGGDRVTYTRDENGMMEVKMIDDPAEIRVIDPDGKQMATWSLEVTPQAINVAEDGTVFVGGEGRLAKLDKNGKVLQMADSPHVAELRPLPEVPEDESKDGKEVSEEEQEAKQAKIAALIERSKAAMATLQEASRGMKATEGAEKAYAAAREKFSKVYEEYIAVNEELRELTTSPRMLAMQRWAAALRKRAITGIAVTVNDLFVACPAAKGYGYDVWRMDLDLRNAMKIVTGLRGCCGQMDIQALRGELFVAENSRGRVVRYDREGKQLAAWGKKDRKDPKCFGSCCNPMNIRLGPGGEVYTSEASVGCVKRFTSDGEFLGLVGSVKLIPGCKHVAIDVNQDGSRVYVLDITRSHIAVLAR